MPDGFQPDEDTWYFSRVCGTFKERAGWHGCQMPEQLLGRIIRASSNPGDVVLDPFAGSGTTLVVAKKLGRRWLGFELSPNYAAKTQARLDAAQESQPLEGAEDPRVSAPSTAAGKRRETPRREAVADALRIRFGEDAKAAILPLLEHIEDAERLPQSCMRLAIRCTARTNSGPDWTPDQHRPGRRGTGNTGEEGETIDTG